MRGKQKDYKKKHKITTNINKNKSTKNNYNDKQR
jgi:hypothetical protein